MFLLSDYRTIEYLERVFLVELIILNYLAKNELKPYWVNTSLNDLIKLTLKKSTTVKEKIERLLKGETIEVPINLETVIVRIEDNIWGLMLRTGY